MNYKATIELFSSNKILSTLATLAVMSMMLVPFAIVYAASSSYGFTMVYEVVNGCSNNEFHTLDSGTAYLSGSTSAGGSTIDVQYELEREVFGFNPSYGSVNGGVNQSFSNLAFPSSVPSDDNFCIIAYRNGHDAYTVTGSGTLHN